MTALFESAVSPRPSRRGETLFAGPYPLRPGISRIIEALRSKLRRDFDPSEEQTIRLCPLTPQLSAGNGSPADANRGCRLSLPVHLFY